MRVVRVCAAVLFTAPVAWGHAVRWEPVQGATGVVFRYDDGTPVAFSEVQVFGPGDPDPAVEGGSDGEGRFAFFADRPGAWRVAIDDGLGHRAEALLEGAGSGPWEGGAPRVLSRWPGAVAGLGTLFGIFGIGSLWAGRRRRSAGAGGGR